VNRKAVLAIVLGLLTAGSLWWVQAPPRSDAAYREHALKQAESLISHVQTARAWVREVGRERTLHRAALVGLQEAEHDATKTVSSFESLDPPAGQGYLRARFAAHGTEATDVLARLRIAARRGEWERVGAELDTLARVAERLERFAEGIVP
jgi:hypothetical protein